MDEYGMTTDQLSLTFGALADPTRRALLARLAEGEATVNELAAPFPMSLQAISKHLKVLENAGLISRGRNAQWRPCQLRAAPLADVTDWLERYRQFWDASFDRLTAHLQQLQLQQLQLQQDTPQANKQDTPQANKQDTPQATADAAAAPKKGKRNG
jgi:DNA-binding transcriptional ArsR family regulator